MRRTSYLAAYLALSVFFCWPLFAQPLAGGNGDWDQHTFYYASVLRSVADGQLPFWNPWYCGGNVLWANPQVSLVSPVYLLSFVMPLTLAMKVNVVAHYLVGFIGMHLLLRRVVKLQSPAVVVYCASLFVFSGGLALHTRTGHVNFLPVFLLPLLLYCFFRLTAGHIRSLLYGGAVLAFAVLNGGSHVVPLATILLGAVGLGALVGGRAIKPLILAASIVVLGCVYAAPKLIPIGAFIKSAEFQDRRPVKHPDFMSLDMLQRALADGTQGTDLKIPGGVQKYGWHEYGNYMGWFGAALAALAAIWILAFRWRRAHWRETSLAIAFIAALVMAAGEFSAFAPANWIRSLPGLENFRIPSRNILLVPLAGSLCIAFAVRTEEDRPWQSIARVMAELLCVVGILQLSLMNREAYRDVFIMAPTGTESQVFGVGMPTIAPREPASAALSRLGENSNLIRSMGEGVSPLNCYEQLIVRRVAQPGPAGIVGSDNVTVSSSTFTPNRVDADVRVASVAADKVVLNQNFADGWSTNFGAAHRDADSGRPFTVIPGSYSGPIRFSFTPPGFWMGLGIFCVGVLASLFVWMNSQVPQSNGTPVKKAHDDSI